MKLLIVNVVATIALLLTACGGKESARTPAPTTGTAGATAPAGATSLPTSGAQAQATAIPGAAQPGGGALATISASPSATALLLSILAPEDQSVVDVSTITIMGKTDPDAVLSINDETVDLTSDGSFSVNVALEEGPNVFNITASDADGKEAATELTIYAMP